MTEEPTGFHRAAARNEFRRIMITAENAANIFERRGANTLRQQAAMAALTRSLVTAIRYMLTDLDHMDPFVLETAEPDFDTDLRLLFDAEENQDDNPGQQHPSGA